MIEKVELLRLEEGGDGTFGVLCLNGRVNCVTLELPDKKNARDISCIPAGRYICSMVDSPRFGRTYEITEVPGRSHILLHAGNVLADTSGCVLLGRHYGVLNGERGVLNSGRAFADFMEQCDGIRSFPLTIRNLTRRKHG